MLEQMLDLFYDCRPNITKLVKEINVNYHLSAIIYLLPHPFSCHTIIWCQREEGQTRPWETNSSTCALCMPQPHLRALLTWYLVSTLDELLMARGFPEFWYAQCLGDPQTLRRINSVIHVQIVSSKVLLNTNSILTQVIYLKNIQNIC